MKNNKNENMIGKEYWRSLERLADTPEFRNFVHREFPQNASELDNAWSRRKFLTLMGASIAMAGMTGCRRPEEAIVPYAKAPEEVIPGVPEYYATTMPFGLSAYGVIVESYEGRPTKIEGNELHPSSKGTSNSFMQASILGLYDPDRSKRILEDGDERDWNDFASHWRSRREKYIANKGEGLAILSEAHSSPTIFRLADDFASIYPLAKWVTFDPVSDENIYEGIRVATGKYYQPEYHFEKARVILSLDSDFLLTESENLNSARGFALGRQIDSDKDDMNRLYVVESAFSITGGMADHRLRLQSRMVGAFIIELMSELESHGPSMNLNGLFPSDRTNHGFDPRWMAALARDLMNNKGQCLIIVGRQQPPGVHALAFALNKYLENIGKTVSYREIKEASISKSGNLKSLVEAMHKGEISTLIIVGANPLYNAPADLEFGDALNRVEDVIQLSQYLDETSHKAQWHLPQSHFLESWGDARAIDGSPSVIQPLIERLYDSRTTVEVINFIITGIDRRGIEIVQLTWKPILSGDFEREWRRVLHDGVLKNSRLFEIDPAFDSIAIINHIRQNPFPSYSADNHNLEIVFRPSANLYDGRFANNGWLQELPDPVTKLSWDNVAVMSPATAQDLGLKNEEMAWLNVNGRKLKMPVWITPGWVDYSVAITLGYGRQSAGKVGNDVGFNSYSLRTSDALYIGYGLTLEKTGEKYPLANTQDHWSMEGRPIVREGSLQHYRENPNFASEMVEHPPLKSLWKEHKYDEGYQWGMTIDLNSCVGCGACTIACQSENNIPIVGKTQVKNGREMHWIRVDRYFSGDIEEPEMVYQPVPCMHCENAPCETVCPVNATVHDREGLNLMTYNRCIGTRYCSNNCPYKVRRFNFFNYTKDTPESMKLLNNPDVTVRSRGVMEKCTYCIQRINRAKMDAKKEGTEVADGEFMTACQQACPTNAIEFGNINNPASNVAKAKNKGRNYNLLEELNVRPRTSYLAKLRNPNPELESLSGSGS